MLHRGDAVVGTLLVVQPASTGRVPAAKQSTMKKDGKQPEADTTIKRERDSKGFPGRLQSDISFPTFQSLT